MGEGSEAAGQTRAVLRNRLPKLLDAINKIIVTYLSCFLDIIDDQIIA